MLDRYQSTDCLLAKDADRDVVKTVLSEYGRVVNCFIDQFWQNDQKDCPRKSQLLKPIVDSVSSWLSFTMRQRAASLAISMIKKARRTDLEKPYHEGKNIYLSSYMARVKVVNYSTVMHVRCIGKLKDKKLILDLPIELSKEYCQWYESPEPFYILTAECVRFFFDRDED